ncbi:VOC family protein [Pseudoxanthomonas sp. z9]|uniref:VOC family protein n=1 Tax=Pseudoxanthomonas sp. z9 TaxID=2584942 RepID=UPI001144D9F0|nr:VOC family protein [Pseudoxanthomonas sp. z9]MCL6713252.1 VOC family protein [Pseudomonas sp. R2.Fl]
MRLKHYLSFDGDCRQALTWYAGLLGGQVVAMQSFGETPGCGDLPAALKERILHGRVDVDAFSLMGTDATPDHPYQGVTGAYVVIDLDDPEQAESLYATLSEGAQVVEMPLQQTFWARRYGSLADRHGVRWMINCT